jgi:hypothetical protein
MFAKKKEAQSQSLLYAVPTFRFNLPPPDSEIVGIRLIARVSFKLVIQVISHPVHSLGSIVAGAEEILYVAFESVVNKEDNVLASSSMQWSSLLSVFRLLQTHGRNIG